MNLFIKIFLIVSLLQISLSARDINIDKLVNTANKTDKHLFVWLHKTDCGYCDSMYEFTLDNDTVSTLVKKKFIFVHINVHHKDTVKYEGFIGSGRDFAKYVGFDFYPTSLFFNKESEVIYEAMGYHDEVEFYKVLNFINTKSYEKMDYYAFEEDFKIKEEL